MAYAYARGILLWSLHHETLHVNEFIHTQPLLKVGPPECHLTEGETEAQI